MTNPIDTAFPSTGQGPRSAVTGLLKQNFSFILDTLTEARGTDLSGYREVRLLETGNTYKYSALETGADDGVTIFHDSEANRFVLANQWVKSSDDSVTDMIKMTQATYDALGTKSATTIYIIVD